MNTETPLEGRNGNGSSSPLPAVAAPQAALADVTRESEECPSITALLEAANDLRKMDEILENNDHNGGSSPTHTIAEIAENLTDEDPFFDAPDSDSCPDEEDDNANSKPAYTAETVAAISSLMKGEESPLFAADADDETGSAETEDGSLPENGKKRRRKKSALTKREITLQDRATAMISVYKDYLLELEEKEYNKNEDEDDGSDHEQVIHPTSFVGDGNIPLHHAVEDQLRREEIKVATLEKFCNNIPDRDSNDDSYDDDSDDDDDIYNVDIDSDDDDIKLHGRRLHSLHPPALARPPKITPRITAATTTAAFRLKAEVALRAAANSTKNAAKMAAGAVKTKVRDRMAKPEDIQEQANEVENNFDFQDYQRKLSGEEVQREVQDEMQEDMEYGMPTNTDHDEENGIQYYTHEMQNGDKAVYGMHILDRDQASLKRKPSGGIDDDEEDEAIGIFNDLCDELGVTPNSHPGLRHFYQHPRSTRYRYPIFRTKKFRRAMMYGGVLVLTLLVIVSLLSAVSNGFERVRKINAPPLFEKRKKKDAPPLPDWKTEESWREEQKIEWEKDHAGKDGESKVGSTASSAIQDKDDLFQMVSAAYRPVWYDRSTGWTGQTYPEAVAWCDSHGGYIPCPYEVYCPDEKTLLAGVMDEDGESWAPVVNAEDEWVQVGTGTPCDLYSTSYQKHPDWGGDGGLENETATRHIMCCRAHPLQDGVGGKGGEHIVARPNGPPDNVGADKEWDEQLPPPPPTTESPDRPHGDSDSALEVLFLTTSKLYNPIWFDRGSGWEGHTYQESLDFCAELDDYILCPYEAYCPGGRGKLLDGIQDQGESWSAVMDDPNDWVQVGVGGECNLYSKAEQELPSWGTTGENNEEITRHIMCCHSNDYEGGTAIMSDIAAPPLVALPKPEEMMTELEKQIEDLHHPTWYGAEFGWAGTTYNDAMTFCESIPHGKGTLHLCPMAAYCPNGPIDDTPLYLQMDAFEGVQWAPSSNQDNDWIMVGSFNEHSPMTCHTYLDIHHKEPDWGLDGTSPELKEHILCCREGEEPQDHPLPTPSAQSSAGDENADDVASQQPDNGSSSAAKSPSSMTESETQIQYTHHPAWFNNEFGWRGTTYDDARAFCESIPHGEGTLQLCPLEAYCPNGPRDMEPLYLQMDAFDGVQWAPYSGGDNVWLMVGNIDGGQLTCQTYADINRRDPAWGLDGTSTQLKEHILCCENNSGSNGGGIVGAGDSAGQLIGNDDDSSLRAEPPSSTATSETDNSGVGVDIESADAAAGPGDGPAAERPPSATSSAMRIENAYRPAWFGSENGWRGTTYGEAQAFCESQPRGAGTLHLCPPEAYCPDGPRDAEPLYPRMEAFDGVQWAPYTGGGDNTWLMVGNIDEGQLLCQTYVDINSHDPAWGLDGTSTQLKEHILCCETNSVNDGGGVIEGDEQGPITVPSDYAADDGGDEVSVTNNSAVSNNSGVEGSGIPVPINNSQAVGNHTSFEESVTKSFNPLWFDVNRGGWDGGSHNDAIRFCEQFAGSHGKRMELCPYAAYCPTGPSKPVIGGHSMADFDAEGEQWAPVFGKSNHWVMIGKRGHNSATTCLSHVQLTGEEPQWGLDGSNKGAKKHVLCCSPLQ